MARKQESRYIQYYVGTAAPKLVPQLPKKNKTKLPKVYKQQSYTVQVDPLALGGIVVSVVMLVLMAVGFFVPGAVLLYRGYKARNPGRIKAICAISLVWLVMTLVLLILNFLTAGATALAGDLLYGFLVILSAPMFCGQAWVLSLFLWACLLMSGLSCLKKIKQ